MRLPQKYLVGAMCAALIVTAPNEALAIRDGNELLEFATSEQPLVQAHYVGYVVGVVHGFHMAYVLWEKDVPFCLGDATTKGDMADAVRIYLRQNPQHLEMKPLTAELVAVAMAAHFPCEADGP